MRVTEGLNDVLDDRAGGGAPVLFYDEHCSVCRRIVSLIVAADHGGLLRIAPLQGHHGDALRLRHPEFADRESAIWCPIQGDPVQNSDAVLGALAYIGGGWRPIARIGRLIPAKFRDWVYRVLAHNRRYFGRFGLTELDQRSRQRLLSDKPESHPW